MDIDSTPPNNMVPASPSTNSQSMVGANVTPDAANPSTPWPEQGLPNAPSAAHIANPTTTPGPTGNSHTAVHQWVNNTHTTANEQHLQALHNEELSKRQGSHPSYYPYQPPYYAGAHQYPYGHYYYPQPHQQAFAPLLAHQQPRAPLAPGASTSTWPHPGYQQSTPTSQHPGQQQQQQQRPSPLPSPHIPSLNAPAQKQSHSHEPAQPSGVSDLSYLSTGHSDSDMEMSSSAAESDASTSTIRGKRRRTEDDVGPPPPPAGPSTIPDPKGKGKTVVPPVNNHAIPADIEVLHAQIATMQDEMQRLSRTIAHQANQTPTGDAEGWKDRMLEGMQETITLLRTTVSLPAFSAANPTPNRSTNADVDMQEIPNVVGEVKRGPVARSHDSKRLAYLVRKYFKDIYKGAIDNRAGWQPAHGPCCNTENFRLDLSKPPGDSWNISAKKVFLEGFFGRDDPVVVQLGATKADVARLFVSNYRRARCKVQWDVLPSEEKEAALRARRRSERKRWLYYRRVRIAERYTETRRHLPLLGALGPDGMSTDASDHDNGTGHPVCRIMEEPWRHPDAAHCLRALDALHRDSRFRPVRRNTQGAHPHQRIVSPLVSTRVPPSKLLSGYYNPAWLQVQTAAMKEYLEIIPSEPYSFSHTATIEDLVDRNNGKLDSIHGFA